MVFLRQYLAPLVAVIIFLLALVAVSARIFLVDDMAAPAPVESIAYLAQPHGSTLSPTQKILPDQMADLPDSFATLSKGTANDRPSFSHARQAA